MLKKVKFLTVVALLFVFFMTGCSQHSSTITVNGKDSISSKSVEIHIVGINISEKRQWDELSMNEYWQPGNQFSASAQQRRVTLYMGEGKAASFVVSKKDYPDIWAEWKRRNACYLVILVDMPIVSSPYKDMVGNADSRRLCVPFDPCCWKGGKIEFDVEQGAIIATNIKSGGSFFCECSID